MRGYSICGINCDTCIYVDELKCIGCRESKGNMSYGTCEVAKCALTKKLNHCGECIIFPCDLLKSYSYDKVQGDNGERICNLEKLSKETV